MEKLFDRIACDCLLSEEARECRQPSCPPVRPFRLPRQELKVLLLGIAESGKSTILKQMRIIHGEGFSTKDKLKFEPLIYECVLTAIQSLLRAMETLGIPIGDSQTEKNASIINAINAANLTTLDEHDLTYINNLWSDPGVKEAFARRRNYLLTDSAEYFLASLSRLAEPGYVPTEQDILRVRVPTTGIVEYLFKLRDVPFRMIDVGGMRTLRRKWIHCFDTVTSIIFIAALSDYDQNRLEESLAQFYDILRCYYLEQASVILFLNKTVIFKEKMRTSNLSDHFTDFTGPPNDYMGARTFLLNLFLKAVPEGTTVHTHFTCAIDTKHVQEVFSAVVDTVLQHRLQQISLV